ncbi:MAG TPA: extracellular solute-binding protein [Thermomicrobiales bacterium]|nr:extracellular solute-binding protein [Thermomicrobiales bacterium]
MTDLAQEAQKLRSLLHTPIGRRRLLQAGVSAAALGTFIARNPGIAFAQDASDKTGVDPAKWSPEEIAKIAGTIEVDTAAEVAKIVPLDYSGKTSYWWVGPTEATSDIEKKIDGEFWDAWAKTYPNIPLKLGDNLQNVGYNDLLDKVRTAATGGAAPDVCKMPIMWGVEFAARGQLREVKLEDFGYSTDIFWPGALKSVTWEDKLYGIPTNNETMGFIWNRAIFEKAGLDPESPPKTWDDVVTYSKQIKDATGKAGFGLVARVNAGNTPFRFMPMLWAYGSGALDEAEDSPTYKTVMINNEGGIAALQAAYDMYVRDKSVPASALTNTQTENGDLYIAGEIAMMISHPSEYAALLDKASKATGPDKEFADAIVENTMYGLIPEGPVRRAVVFGGSNVHIFNDDTTGHTVDLDAAKALIAFSTGPEWSTKNAWVSSNPGNLRGFETKWMKERLDTIKFLNQTTSMLPYGIPFPVIPQSTQIMNEIVPNMLQNALTESKSVKDSADQAADEINALVSGGY